jgi:hypothetical protein
VGVATAIDRAAYARDPAWHPFLEFRPPMDRLLDGPKRVFDATEFETVLGRAGWGLNEWRVFVDYSFVADETVFSLSAVRLLVDETLAVRSPGPMLQGLFAQKSAFAFLPVIVLLAIICLVPGRPAGPERSRRLLVLGRPLEDLAGARAALAVCALWTAVLIAYLLWAEGLPRHVRLPFVHATAVIVAIIGLQHVRAWGALSRPARAGAGIAVAASLALSGVLLVRDVTANRLDRHGHADIRARLMPTTDPVYLLANLEYLRSYPPWAAADAGGRRLMPAVEFARSPLARPVLDSLDLATVIDAIGAGDSVVVVAKPDLVSLLQIHLRDHHGMAREPEIVGSTGEGREMERSREIVAVRFVYGAGSSRLPPVVSSSERMR